MGTGETKAAAQEVAQEAARQKDLPRASEGRVRGLIGRYGMDHSRPDEPNVDAGRLRYPLVVGDPAAFPEDAAVDESGYREIRVGEGPKAWADREYER